MNESVIFNGNSRLACECFKKMPPTGSFRKRSPGKEFKDSVDFSMHREGYATVPGVVLLGKQDLSFIVNVITGFGCEVRYKQGSYCYRAFIVGEKISDAP